MNAWEMRRECATVGAFVTGSHVVYASGRHGSAYFDKDAVYRHPRLVSRLCSSLAVRFVDDRIEAVVGPAIGGTILAQWVAFHLSVFSHRDVIAAYAEKDGHGGFALGRGYDEAVRGKRTLIVEDVLTTGGSALKVVEAVRAAGGEDAGVAALANRGGVMPADVGSPPKFITLLDLEFESWEEVACPLCAEGVTINVAVGHGRVFLARQHG